MSEAVIDTRTQLRSRAIRDGYVILASSVILYIVAATFQFFNKIVAWLYEHQAYELDELITVGIFLLFAGAIFVWRRRNELIAEIRERERIERERTRLIAEVKTLNGLLPICAWCKRIRDDKGYWNQLEAYISSHTDAEFTHGICPDCLSKVQVQQRRGAGG